MTRIRGGRLIGALALPALALAGCAVPPAAGQGTASPASGATGTGQPAEATTTSPAAAATTTSKQRAENDAAAILATFTAPSGVDDLPVFPPGRYSCPYGDGAALTLTFGTKQAGPALAVATVSLDGCAGVAFTVNGKPQPGLGAVAGGQRVAAQALKAVGLNWKQASYPCRYTGYR